MHINKPPKANSFRMNPRLDHLFGYHGKLPVITKQDGYKALAKHLYHEDGTREDQKLYVLKASHHEFDDMFKKVAQEAFQNKPVIKKPKTLELIISISMTKKRFNAQVDLDNLSKRILDCLKNIVYEDDSQVTSLIVSKHVHELDTNGLLVGIIELDEYKKGFAHDIKLYDSLTL